MNTSFENISVSGIAVALPHNKLELSSLSQLYGTNEVQRIMANTGISAVRVADAQTKTSDLCFMAARELIAKMTVNSVDAIVFVSQTHDAVMPATSVMLQHRLGLSTNTVAFDISYGCSGYVYGLYQAAMLIAAGGCQRVLLCTGDVITPLLYPTDKHVRLVFGDAGSATLIERGNDCLSFILRSDGSGMDHLKAAKQKNEITHDGYLHMNGSAIMEFALREVPKMIAELLQVKNWHAEEVGSYVLHQANEFMLNYLRKKMALSKEAVPIAVENTGNTSSASIPLTLALTSDRLRQENRLNKAILCGFGVGLSWAATSLDLSKALILSPLEYLSH
ncbi:MAG: ketoacyl-ACP synthase III [Gammaproteobacteria bacterium]|nr:ketoacyl-ACP synthase III [Gammaproteobacteria bacterium]